MQEILWGLFLETGDIEAFLDYKYYVTLGRLPGDRGLHGLCE